MKIFLLKTQEDKKVQDSFTKILNKTFAQKYIINSVETINLIQFWEKTNSKNINQFILNLSNHINKYKQEKIIIGYSISGSFTLKISKHIENLKKIILIATPYSTKCIQKMLIIFIFFGILLSKNIISRKILKITEKLFFNRLTIRLSNPSKFFKKLSKIYKEFSLPKKQEEIKIFFVLLRIFVFSDYTKMLNENNFEILSIIGDKDRIFNIKKLKHWDKFKLVKLIVISNADHDIPIQNPEELIKQLKQNI